MTPPAPSTAPRAGAVSGIAPAGLSSRGVAGASGERVAPWRLVRAWCGHGLRRLGPWGLSALGAWLALGALALSGAQIDRMRVGLQADLVAVAAQPAPDRAAITDRPATLFEALPDDARAGDFVEFVHREATRAAVSIERADYRAPASPPPLARLQIALPVAGTYPAVARWLATVLQRHPEAAIDELVVQRTDQPGRLQARVVLSHYSRLPGIGPTSGTGPGSEPGSGR